MAEDPFAQLDMFSDALPSPVGPKKNVYVGTCSWTDPSLIKSKRFYPPQTGTSDLRLRYYATQFPVVEVDGTFFSLLDPANAQLWADRTPANFRFNVKTFRLLTGHQTPPEVFPPDLRAALPPLPAKKKNWYYADVPVEIRDELWRRFIVALAPLRQAGKLKAVLFQFAPWVTGAPEWRRHGEECVERMAGHLVAVEFRNRSWFGDGQTESTLAWERDLRVAHVIVDEPQEIGNYAHCVWAVTNPQLAIVRLHGRNETTWRGKGLSASSERFNYEYSDAELAEISERMLTLAEYALELQALVNVNYEDQGVRAAKKLQALSERY